jgi:adenylylsulfate kinase-like enzyme
VGHLTKGFLLDTNILRQVRPEPYTEEGRRRNVQRTQGIAAYLAAMGYQVCVDCVSPYRDQREEFKAEQLGRILEVYVSRDNPRAVDWGAREIRDHYQPPEVTDIHLPLRTDVLDVSQCLHQILAQLLPSQRLEVF